VAKKINVMRNGRRKTNQDSDPYPFLHIRSKIKVQNRM
jgi:hypothetical protein